MNTSEVKLLFEVLDEFFKQLRNAPTGVLLFVFIIFTGYVLQFMPWLPPKFIPMVLCIISVVAFVRLGDPGMVGERRNPNEMLAVFGVIVFGVAWLTHKLILQHFDGAARRGLKHALQYLVSKLPNGNGKHHRK